MKLPYSKILPWIALIVVSFFLFRQCNNNAAEDRSRESEKEFLNDTIEYYENEIGQATAEKKALQGDKQTLQVLLSKQIDSTGQLKRIVKNFRKVDAAGNISTQVVFDTIPIPYKVPVPDSFQRDFIKKDQHYFLSGISNQNGIRLDSISFPNTLSFAIGEKRTGLFKNEYKIEATNSNPYLRITGLDSYTVEVPKKRLGLSLYTGYGLGSNFTLTPQIGFGLTYNLIRF